MEKEYEDFVEEFRHKLIETTGYGEERIFFKRKDADPITSNDRLFVKRAEQEGVSEVCALHVNELYEEYQNGCSISRLVQCVVRRLEQLEKADLVSMAKELDNYEKTRDRLFIRLVSLEKNRKELEGAVYRRLGDIALALYVYLGEIDGGITSIKVKQPILEAWERNQEEIIDAALLNTYYISPPRIYCWEEMLFNPQYEGENFMNILKDYPIRRDAVGNCLSTVKRINGAVAVFLPGVAERLSDLLQGNFYLVFTSIHEVMIHSEKSVDPEDLRHVLADTVRDTTPEQDFLTLNIYYYDRNSASFSLWRKAGN